MATDESRGEERRPGTALNTTEQIRSTRFRDDAPEGRQNVYAALDLGTNNCRLLVAKPSRHGFRVLDAFSRIVRLGEGLASNPDLSEAAMDRTVEALKVCRSKLEYRQVNRLRLVTTEACRAAGNGQLFLDRVESETGLKLEILDRKEEARLAAAGCSTLADRHAENVVVFDIGGGSTEIVWLKHETNGAHGRRHRIAAWDSLKAGVVTLAERHNGKHVTRETFEDMIDDVAVMLRDFAETAKEVIDSPNFHLLGTSGTVTTLAGVHLGLQRYDRRQVDGLWMQDRDIDDVIETLLTMPFAERSANGCIGMERADLVLPGCAIFETIRRAFPSHRVRIADRGLREGILVELMRADGVWQDGRAT